MTYLLTFRDWIKSSESEKKELEKLKLEGKLTVKPIDLTNCLITIEEANKCQKP